MEVDMNNLFGTLYNKALEGDKDCGGLLCLQLLLRRTNLPDLKRDVRYSFVLRIANFNLANFMRSHLYTSLAHSEDGYGYSDQRRKCRHWIGLMGHGGLFKTKGVGQSIMAAAMDAPVTVMETAGEGGAWGIALLAAYMKR